MALRRPEKQTRSASSAIEDTRKRLREARERQSARVALQRRSRKLGELEHLADDGEEPEPVEGLDDSHSAVADIGKKRKVKNKLSGEELEKWKKARQRVKEIRERQADASYYCVLVFDTGGQCQAFLDRLMAKHVIARDGDLFVDGRHIAEAFGIELLPPEYEMTTSVALSKGKAKDMAKVPKGYKA